MSKNKKIVLRNLVSIEDISSIDLQKVHDNIQTEIKADIENKFKMKYKEGISIILKILSKPFRNRTKKELGEIFEFLSICNFPEYVKDDIEISNLQQLFYFACQFMSTKRYRKGDVIYNEGGNNDYIYLVVEGNVGLYNIKKNECEMSALEYYNYLYSISQDRYLISNTIKINKDIYPVFKINDLEKINEFYFKFKLIEYVENYESEKIDKLLNEYQKTKEDIKYDKVLDNTITQDEYCEELKNNLSNNEKFYFDFLKKDKKNKIFKIECDLVHTIIEKNFFGNYDINKKDALRENTAIVLNDNTLLLYINKNSYIECIFAEEQNNKNKEIEPIYLNTFFKSIRHSVFVNKFYYNFEKIILFKDENLFNENEKLNYVYFLREGKVEVYLKNKNIFYLFDNINYLKMLDKEFRLKEENFNFQSDVKKLLDSLEQKKYNLPLFTYDKIECFGLFEYFFNIPTIYNVRIVSEKAKIFRINLSEIVNEEDKFEDQKLFKESIEQNSKQIVKNILERLIYFRNTILKKNDIEYNKESIIISYHYYNNFDIKKAKNNKKIINEINKYEYNKIMNELNKKSSALRKISSLTNKSQNSIKLVNNPIKIKNEINNYFTEESGYLKTNVGVQVDNSFDKYNENDKKYINLENDASFLRFKLLQNKIEKSKRNFENNNAFFSQEINIIYPKINKPRILKSPKERKKIYTRNSSEILPSISYDFINRNKSPNYYAIKKFYNQYDNNNLKRWFIHLKKNKKV